MARNPNIRVLGPIEVEIEGVPVDLGGAKPRTLLAALVLNRGRVVTVDTLVETLWGDDPPATAKKSIHKYVSTLRRDLGDTVVTHPSGYLLSLDHANVDVSSFESMFHDGEAETALQLWRGEAYPELVDTVSGRAETTRLGELRLQAMENVLEQEVSTGQPAVAIGELESLISIHPYRERLWGLLMLAFYRSGRQSDALAAFTRLRTLLGEELGIDPSPELASLEERILLHDPTLATPDPEPEHNLPAPLTTFVGRIRELTHLMALLDESRLVTLLGPGGSGKTRLALETGRSVLDRYPKDGVWFIDLSPARSPDQVVGAVAKTLGVGGSGDRDVETVLHDFLASRGPLLILDNCEHLIGEVAAVIRSLLESAPKVVVLATSRERVGVPGETVYEVAPLPYPELGVAATEEFDAVRLFMERVRAGGTPVEGPSEVVGEIVRRLDGIPLALELAAARVRGLGLVELRDHLDDRFALLTSPTGPDRHQTLQASVDWSFRLLGPREQILFGRLSVFRGGFDLDAVVEVCGHDPLDPKEVPRLLADLVDKSLVTATGGDRRRYRLLETLREYALGVAATEKLARLGELHAAHYLRVAEDANRHLRGPDQASRLAALSSDYDNLTGALRWATDHSPETMVRLATALGSYWDTVGPRSHGHRCLSRAVDVAGDLDPQLRVDVLLEASKLFSSQHASLPRSYAEEALKLSREIGYDLGVARALRALSWALAIDGVTDEAYAVGMEAFDFLAEHEDPWELALWYERMGQASFRDPRSSIDKLNRALRIYRDVGDRSREALVLMKIAEQLAGGDGDLDQALEYVERAIAICDEVGNVHDGAHSRLECGKVLRRAGRYKGSTLMLDEAVAQLRKQGDERCTIRAITALGTTHLDAGDPAMAEAPLREALERGRILAELRPMRSAIAGMARIAALEGAKARAVQLLGFVDEVGRQLDVPTTEVSLGKRDARLAILRTHLGRVEFDSAWERGRGMTLDEAIDLALTTGSTANES